jgi:hypothetical protein
MAAAAGAIVAARAGLAAVRAPPLILAANPPAEWPAKPPDAPMRCAASATLPSAKTATIAVSASGRRDLLRLFDRFIAELVVFERMAWLPSTEAARAVPPP